MITDTTQDVSKVDQMSQIFRYVTIERDSQGAAMAVKINKSFLGFLQIPDSSAGTIANVINVRLRKKVSIFQNAMAKDLMVPRI